MATDPTDGGTGDLAPHLARVTVRLQAGKSLATGFFVTDRLILTCAHLLPRDASPGQEVDAVVGETARRGHITRIFQDLPDYPDLLGVELAEPYPGHGWAYLLPGAIAGDEVYAYGFPERYRGGDSFYGRLEGLSGIGTGHELLKFKETKVGPGVSGSPLLDLRTGGVCGMIQKERLTADGGRALPAEVILRLLPEVGKWQEERASGNLGWLRMLSPGQLDEGNWPTPVIRAMRPAYDPFRAYCLSLADAADDYLSQGLLPGADPLELSATESPEVLSRQLPEALTTWKPPIFAINVRTTTLTPTAAPAVFTSLEQALESNRWRMLLLGEPGAGKTVSLLVIAKKLAQERALNRDAPIPLYAPVRLWRSGSDQSIASWLARVCGIPLDDVTDAITGGNAVILLDGLDEPERPVPKAELNPADMSDEPVTFLQALADLPDTRVVVSCRREDYDAVVTTAPARLPFLGAATLDRLTEEQVLNYVDQIPALRDALRGDAALLRLAANPLLLALLANTYILAPAGAGSARLTPSAEGGAHEVFVRFVQTRYEWEAERPSTEVPCSLEELYHALGTALVNSISLDDPSGDWILDRGALETVAGDRCDIILQFAVRMGLLVGSRYRALATFRFVFRHALLRDHFAYPAAIASLSVTSDEELIAAVRALGRIGDAKAAAKLMEIIDAESTPAAVRGSAVTALGPLRDPATYPLLRSMLRNEDMQFAMAAATAWAAHGGPVAVSELEAVIAEGNEAHSVPAILSLGLMTASNALACERYLELLRRENHIALLFAMLAELSGTDAKREYKSICEKALASAQDSNLKFSIITGLARNLRTDALSLIFPFIDDPSVNVSDGVKLLIRGMQKTATPFLIEYANGGDQEALVRVLSIIGSKDDEAAARFAAPYVGHPDERVRVEAVMALSRTGDAGFPIAKELFETADNELDAASAAMALAFGPVTSYEWLVRQLANTDQVRRAGAEGALSIRFYAYNATHAHVGPLINALREAEPPVAQLLCRTIVGTGSIDAWHQMEQLADTLPAPVARIVADNAQAMQDLFLRFLRQQRIKENLSRPDLVAAADLLRSIDDMSFSANMEAAMEAMESGDGELMLAALAPIIFASDGNITELATRLSESSDGPDAKIARSSAAIILVGGGDPARKLVDLLEHQPVQMQASLGEHVREVATARFTSTVIRVRQMMTALDRPQDRPRSQSGRKKKGAARDGRLTQPSASVTFKSSAQRQSGLVKVLTVGLNQGGSIPAQVFIVRWLAYHRVASARSAFLDMTRASPPLSHLGVLGLGLLGKPGDAKRIIGYARKADSVGRACAVTSVIRLRRQRWAKFIGADSHFQAIWEALETPSVDEEEDEERAEQVSPHA